MSFSKHSGVYEGPMAREGRPWASSQSFAHGRLSCPDELIDKVISVTGLTARHSLLDLGCGDGRLGIAFAPFVQKVIGLDSDPNMLDVAAAYAREREAEVTFRCGDDFRLDHLVGCFQLVTIGSAFQRMDRAATLEALNKIVFPFGALALFRDSHPEIPQNLWYKRLRSVMRSYAQTERPLSSSAPAGIADEFFLLNSKFNRLERISVIQRIESPVERVIHRAWSISSSSSARLDYETKMLFEKLREVVNQQAVNGVITEVIESEALIAFRSDPSSP